MPPKPKFTKDEIVQAALEVVSQKGVEALTAKELGDALGSSARPIFTVFHSMKEVQDEVRAAAMRRFERFAAQTLPDMPLFKQVGMRMVLFGALGSTAETCIQSLRNAHGLTEAESRLLFETVWIYTFGIGALCATGTCRFSEQRLGEMLSTEFQAMLLFVKPDAADGS